MGEDSIVEHTNSRTATTNDRWRLPLLVAGAAYVFGVAFVPGFSDWSPLQCTPHRFFGVHCPTCGLTRSLACLLRLDMVSAIQFNPLVVFVAPVAATLILEGVMAAAGCRRPLLPSPAGSLRRWCWQLFLIGFAALALVRLVSWLLPAWNPDGLFLPPAEFPG